jgi:xylulokinase
MRFIPYLSGVTMTIRDCLTAVPVPPDRLALCGGGTRSDFWMRLIADVTGLPVTLPASAEVGARGAWLTGLVATGREPDFRTAADRYVEVAATYQPDPQAFDDFSDQYAGFLRLRELKRPLWAGDRGQTLPTSGADA